MPCNMGMTEANVASDAAFRAKRDGRELAARVAELEQALCLSLIHI